MRYITDKTILILLSACMLFHYTSGGNIVIVLLIVMLATVLNSFFEEKKYIWISVALYAAVMWFLPDLIYMVPVMFYDAFAYATVIPFGLLTIGCLQYCMGMSPFAILYLLLCILIGYYMYRRSARLEDLEHKVRKIRDDEEERNILLAEKNRSLIERQDQEVYVATLRERNRIAREIHDNVGHILTRTILQMGALMTIYKEEPLHGQLVSVKDNLDVAMNNVRDSVHDLHDESVDLRQAVDDIAEGLKARFHYHVEYDIYGCVDRQYKYAMIGIIREGVSNILKHSHNENVDIVLREHPGMYQIIIHDYALADTDSGRTVSGETSAAKLPRGGIGLQNIQDRTAGLDGHMTVSTEHGFRVFVTLPKPKDTI